MTTTNQKIIDTLNQRPKPINLYLSLVTVFLLLTWSLIGLDGFKIPENGIQIARNIILGILNPSADLIFSLNAQSVLYLLFETIMIAFLGTFIGVLISMFFAFLGASNLTPKFIHKTIRYLLSIIRTIPAIVYGLMVIRVTGPGPFAGVVTFSLVSIGLVSKMFIEDIEETSKGLIEVAQVAGLNWLQKVRLIYFPQNLNCLISTSIYRFEINLREAAILGLIGGGGLGTPLILAMAESRWEDVGAYLLGLIVLVLIVEFFSTKIRTKLTRG